MAEYDTRRYECKKNVYVKKIIFGIQLHPIVEKENTYQSLYKMKL